MKRCFSKEDLQITNKYMERKSLDIREIQIKATMKYYLTPINKKMENKW